MVRFLQGRRDSDILETGEDLETFILQEVIAWRDLHEPAMQISYYRSKSKVEIDFVFSLRSAVIFLEIKTCNRLSEHDFSALKCMSEESNLKMRRILVNPHVISQDREDGIEIISVT